MLRTIAGRPTRRRLGAAAAIVGMLSVEPQAVYGAENPPAYVLPDLPATRLVHDGVRYSIRPIIAILADYTFFEQDEVSLARVGEQEDSRDLRAGRVGMFVRSKGERPWEAYVAFDYQEKRTREQYADALVSPAVVLLTPEGIIIAPPRERRQRDSPASALITPVIASSDAPKSSARKRP